MLYLDTSPLVAALRNEADTGRMQTWLDEQWSVISDWVAPEFSSALSIKLRTGQIDAGDRAEVLATFTRLATDSRTVVPVSRSRFRSAPRLADQHMLGLRAGNALHLPVCADYGATLCTLDQRLNNAGSVLSIKTMLL